MPKLRRGDLVELDGLLAAVVGIDGDVGVPEDHIALWFGDPPCQCMSEGGVGGQRPEVWTVPEEYVKEAASPVYKH